MSKVDPGKVKELIEQLESLLECLPNADLMERFIKAVNECPSADDIYLLARTVKDLKDVRGNS